MLRVEKTVRQRTVNGGRSSQDGWTTVRQQTVNGGKSGWLDNCQAADSKWRDVRTGKMSGSRQLMGCQDWKNVRQ